MMRWSSTPATGSWRASTASLSKSLRCIGAGICATKPVLPHSAAEHRAILKAIASGDAEHAGSAMYDHVIESKQRGVAWKRRQAEGVACAGGEEGSGVSQ